MSAESPFAALSPKLAEALTQRGFTQLTPIQERVLDPDLAGHDLRLASQTGSGKTVAVGFVIAQAIEAQPTATKGPIAVLIAPTRELAAQLQKELTWLLAPLSAKVAVVAGGASYRDELRAIRQGVRVVVGTPGRLLDHLEKGSFETTGIKVVVLDEADQMLDLGFRDELEAILAKMPEERRTHMVSATFPREVLHLAQRFQKSAMMVEGTQPGEANTDIEHVAHVVRPFDKEAALINLLLMAPEERALLFVRTRAGASDLAQLLTEAGFRALPLSGELEQKDRNKTLAAFKNGSCRTLVATDVAARGLDVPEVARVIHVEPPTDGEGFTHRSGRTGRAGKKGQSIVLVPPGMRERVRTVMRHAGVQASWLPVPTAADVQRAADERLMAELTGLEPDGRLMSLADRLLETHDPKALVATLLGRSGHSGPTEARSITPFELDRPRQVRTERPDKRDIPLRNDRSRRDDRRRDGINNEEHRHDDRWQRDARPTATPRAEAPRAIEPMRPKAPRVEAPRPIEPRVEAPAVEVRVEAPRPIEAPHVEVAAIEPRVEVAAIERVEVAAIEPRLEVVAIEAPVVPIELPRIEAVIQWAQAEGLIEAAPEAPRAEAPQRTLTLVPPLEAIEPSLEAAAPIAAKPAKEKRRPTKDIPIARKPAPSDERGGRDAARTRDDRPRQDIPLRGDRPREDRPRQDIPLRGDRPRQDFAPRDERRRDDRPRDDRPREDRARGQSRDGEFVPFRINFGERDGADARRLMAMVCRRGRITGGQVGAIRVYGDDSTFEVSAEVAHAFAAAVLLPDPRNPDLQIDAIKDRSAGGYARKPARNDRAPRGRDERSEAPRFGDRPAPKWKKAPTGAPPPSNDGGWDPPRAKRNNSRRAD